MNKLIISSVEFKNFLSYGDYETQVRLEDSGPVLIVGDKSENGSRDFGNSNGAGKSTITTAILWCLFGRTFNKAKPGDKVVNWYTGKNCYVTIRTADGWKITRTRKSDNDNELAINYNGEDKTLSTPTNTQKFLDRQFGLDFDIFTSSMFFGQFSAPFLGLGDQKRKAALERLLNLDKLNLWSLISKDKAKKSESAIGKCTIKINGYESELAKHQEHKDAMEKLADDYEKVKAGKLAQLRKNVNLKEKERDSIIVPDVDRLRIRWDAINKIHEKLKDYETRRNTTSNQIAQLKSSIQRNIQTIEKHQDQLKGFESYDIDSIRLQNAENNKNDDERARIKSVIDNLRRNLIMRQATKDAKLSSITEWESQSGKICPNCKQNIDPDHTSHICDPIQKEINEISEQIERLNREIDEWNEKFGQIAENIRLISVEEAIKINSSSTMMKEEVNRMKSENEASIETIDKLSSEVSSINVLISKVGEQIQKSIPDMTIDEALEIKHSRKLVENEILELNNKINELNRENNPHEASLNLIKNQIKSTTDNMNKAIEARDRLQLLYSHLTYIQSAYGDRKKIKKFILTNLIPSLNQRVQYYLESFECDFGIEFTPTLSILPSKWDYEFCSGGEQKRIDMAIMFALYDLYVDMYGQQCNVMVLDEVDGRLDSTGIESFISIIMNDFCKKDGIHPDTIMVISHRQEMLDVFPSKLLVRMEEGFSFIEPII